MKLRKIDLPFVVKKPVLALGAHTKNTVCFAEGKAAFLSQPHADLSCPQDFLEFERAAKYFLKKRPKIIACDLHPEYLSTKFANTLSAKNYKLSVVQHHHAHIASCMAENRLGNKRVIGIAFDGTGLGTDDTFWGAEALICDYKNFKRMAHLKQIPLLGAGMAISEPFRLAVAWLWEIHGENPFELNLSFLRNIDKSRQQALRNIYLKRINSPLSSSMGRLFDAVGSLVLQEPEANFEAELAIKLERAAQNCKSKEKSYSFKIIKGKDSYIFDPVPMFKEIIQGLSAKEPKEIIAFKFHSTVARITASICSILRDESRINYVVLSGGVFQNKTLLRLTLDLLYNKKFKVLIHKALSCSDLSISLGQAMVASSRGA